MENRLQDALKKNIEDVMGAEATAEALKAELPFNFARKVGGTTLISVINEKFYEDYRKDPRETRAKHGVQMKGGRYITKMFPEITHHELHEFLSKIEGGKIEIVEGEDIRFWYHGKNYSQSEDTDSLGNSCMKHEDCQRYMDIYVENPDVCKMAILKDDSDKLIGRALLWKAQKRASYNSGDYMIMDRIYGTAKTQAKFKEWAKANGYYHKMEQNYCTQGITNGEENLSIENMEVKGYFDYSYYPYLDSFYLVNPDRDKISGSHFSEDDIVLRRTGGGYEDIFESDYWDEYRDDDDGEW